MADPTLALPEVVEVQRLVSLSPKTRREPLVLLMSIAALMCCSLELELIEQLDGLRFYMTFREIFWDASVALLILLGMTMIWWLCLLLVVRLAELLPRQGRRSTALFWRLGLLIPLLYFVLDFFDATRLRFYPRWHPGPIGWLWQGPTLVLLCVAILWMPRLSALQRFCKTRLAPIGWLHMVLAFAAIIGLGAGGVRLFRDYVHPGRGVISKLPDIYLITMDALRSEDMSLYGYNRPTTPNLERFARRASTFDFFFANSNFTTAATASIEDGKLPWTNRVFQLGGFLRGQNQRETLGAALQQRGYYTSVISANSLASPIQHRTLASYDAVEYVPTRNGFRGFVRYSNFVGLNTLYTLSGTLLKGFAGVRLYLDAVIWNDRFASPAEPVFDQVRSLVERADIAQPRFVWAHVLPPHDPYLAPLPFRGSFLPSAKLTRVYGFLGLHNDQLPPGVSVEELRARYDEDIAYTDHVVGSFLDWLDQSGRLDRSIVIISSDHGESFEHGWFKHTGPYLFNGLIRVPLLIHLPGQKQGSRIALPAEQVDLLPTILDLIGSPAPSWSEGASLVPGLQGKPLPDRLLFSMNLEDNSSFEPVTRGTVAVIDDDFKYIER
ncbi:MAG TPA: sulfatase, partial [Terriglobales bacterium]|nr:sulfatase [Terriglobales bacterium]